MIEIELKCEILPEMRERLGEKIGAMRSIGIVENDDIYYDTAEYDLLKRAVFVRVRNGKKLEWKFNEAMDQRHSQSIERAFPLEADAAIVEKINRSGRYFLPQWRDGASFAEAWEKNELIELARIKNRREAYSDGEMAVSIDHVEGLGDFLEVEISCEEGVEAGETDEAEERVRRFVEEVGGEHIRVGYVELWLRRRNPGAYEMGRYRL